MSTKPLADTSPQCLSTRPTSDAYIQRSIVAGEVNPTKTEASEATLPLDPDLAETLLQHKARASYVADFDYVFAGDSGKPGWAGIMLTDHIKPAADKAGSVRWDGTLSAEHIQPCSMPLALHLSFKKNCYGTLTSGQHSTFTPAPYQAKNGKQPRKWPVPYCRLLACTNLYFLRNAELGSSPLN